MQIQKSIIMKTLIISTVLVLFAGFSQAQIIELEEARVSFSPVSLIDENSFSVSVLENYAGEFEKDPLVFMKNNFDIEEFISQLQDEDYESYLVSFRSRKGELRAEFDKVGNLLATNLRFENILLPRDICHQLYRDHKGWTMVKNVHIASGKKDVVNKNFYRITMKNGKEKKNLKIEASKEIRTAMVGL